MISGSWTTTITGNYFMYTMAISCNADSFSLVTSYPSPPAGATTVMVGYYPRYKIEHYTNTDHAPISIDMRDRFTRTGSTAYECG